MYASDRERGVLTSEPHKEQRISGHLFSCRSSYLGKTPRFTSAGSKAQARSLATTACPQNRMHVDYNSPEGRFDCYQSGATSKHCTWTRDGATECWRRQQMIRGWSLRESTNENKGL